MKIRRNYFEKEINNRQSRLFFWLNKILARILKNSDVVSLINKIPKGWTRIWLISWIIRKILSFKPRVLNGERVFWTCFFLFFFVKSIKVRAAFTTSDRVSSWKSLTNQHIVQKLLNLFKKSFKCTMFVYFVISEFFVHQN